MVMIFKGLRNKNDCADEVQQFPRQTDRVTVVTDEGSAVHNAGRSSSLKVFRKVVSCLTDPTLQVDRSFLGEKTNRQ
jgi:hypothetical protein